MITLTKTAPEVKQQSRTLPALLADFGGDGTGNTLAGFMSHILRAYCKREDLSLYDWIPVPARPEWMRNFGGKTAWSRVMKKDGLTRKKSGKAMEFYRPNGNKVKERSLRGYVWIDTDPTQILLNKYCVGSCQTLDNVAHHYQAGNLMHVYNPYVATVFAAPTHPMDDPMVDAISPKTKIPFILRRQTVKIRPHQAILNVFFMRDNKGRPFLVASRVYDSCQAEVPWGLTMLRYLRTRCKRLGIGLAVAAPEEWKQECASSVGYAFDLRTPPFSFGNSLPMMVKHYDDHGLVYKLTVDTNQFVVQKDRVSVLVEPTATGAEAEAFGPAAATGRLRDAVNDVPTWGCALTGVSLNRDELIEGVGGRVFSAQAADQVYKWLDRFAMSITRRSEFEASADPTALVGSIRFWQNRPNDRYNPLAALRANAARDAAGRRRPVAEAEQTPMFDEGALLSFLGTAEARAHWTKTREALAPRFAPKKPATVARKGDSLETARKSDLLPAPLDDQGPGWEFPDDDPELFGEE